MVCCFARRYRGGVAWELTVAQTDLGQGFADCARTALGVQGGEAEEKLVELLDIVAQDVDGVVQGMCVYLHKLGSRCIMALTLTHTRAGTRRSAPTSRGSASPS
jgi:hypothetical protein